MWKETILPSRVRSWQTNVFLVEKKQNKTRTWSNLDSIFNYFWAFLEGMGMSHYFKLKLNQKLSQEQLLIPRLRGLVQLVTVSGAKFSRHLHESVCVIVAHHRTWENISKVLGFWSVWPLIMQRKDICQRGMLVNTWLYNILG